MRIFMAGNLFHDLRYAARMMRKSPGFTFIAVLTLALGIGATTAIFSVVDGVLLRPLPFDKPNEIVRLWEVNANGHQANFTDPNFEDLRSQNHSFQGLAEYASGLTSVSGGSEPTRTMVAAVSQDFFPVLRMQPIRGRGFDADDQHFGAAPTALVSYNYWQQYLGSSADLSSSKLTIGTQAVSIIGVLPPGFRFPDSSDIWMPRELRERLPSRTAHNWRLLGRLRDGVTIQQAYAELTTIAHRIKQEYGQDVDMTGVSLVQMQDAMTSDVRPALLILMGAVAFLLLIACANVVNLMLAQVSGRERELAVRTAIGAARGRLVRQFLTEALLLALTGGVLGVLLARWGVAALLSLAPSGLPFIENVAINLPVLFFALGISVIVALGLGMVAVLRATSVNPQFALAQHGRAQGMGARSQRFGRAIIAGQVAITLILVTGAALLGRSLMNVLSVNPGFRTEHIVTADLALSWEDKDADKIRRVQFLNDLFAQLRAVPGIKEVGGTLRLPLTNTPTPDGSYVVMSPQDQPPAKIEDMEKWFDHASNKGYANYRTVSEGYFRALGIPLVRGRWFDEADTMDAPQVAVITQSLAQEKWPNQDPLGRRIEFGNMDGDLRPLTVVGVVGDIREDNLETKPSPTIYVNYRQRPQGTYNFTVVMRTEADPATVIASARKILRSLDPNLPPKFGTFAEAVSSSLQSRRFNATLVGIFAGVALLLAMAGLYGVTSYAVTKRTGEFGVRIALGASVSSVLRLVLRQGIVTALIGIAAGVAGAFVVTRWLRSLVFDLTTTDPLTFIGVTVTFVLVALAACYIPARRATKVDPMVALRYE
jgi:putative ABC transport system permease protein